jgi:hypothetical protein
MRFARWFRGCLAIGLVGGVATPCAVSASAVALLDHLVITRNLTPLPGEPGGLGSTYEGAAVYYADLFSDGVEPPSGGVFFGPSPGNYFIQFGMYGATDESGGRLRLNSALGTPAVNAAGEGRRTQQVTLLSSTNTTQSLQGLIQAFHTFAVYGRFDIALPPSPGDVYSIKIQDNGPGLMATEELSVGVRRQEDGSLVVFYGRQDFLADTITFLDADALVIPADADQIEFRLERASLASDVVTGAYRFWDGATPSAFTILDNATEFFNNRGWARAGFRAVEFFVPVPGTLSLLLAALGALSVAICRRSG